MIKRTSVWVLRILSLILYYLVVFAPALARCETVPFKVGIAIDVDSLNAASYKTQGVFFVKYTIRNIGSSDRKITVWTQHGWSWLSSSPDVSPGIEALQNISSRGTLHPGEAYESSVEMWIDPRGKRPVTFRLGFYPDATRPVSKKKGAELSKAVSWSNDVTLDK
jgi:hypothetical protein